ncbi:BA14K family protein [Sinorhizobium sp. BG8]|uniref:BA14K family protein n=1 Tax=Sinorhizobium sp. BG8 TaxID=2613773 RepID=UPI00193DB2B6|nr:BA14K family protein [Sinorhizobium sp. BG8]QRM56255.1 BA14K family protein [Sinorhizobium sp. BG8]
MNRLLKVFVLTAAVAATTLSSVGYASADDRYWRRHHHHDNNTDDVLLGGALGLATGLVVGSAIAEPAPRYYRPAPRRVYVEPGYYPARRVYREPRPVVVETLEPWSNGWFRYCSDRYRSFNPRTGTFVGYDGMEHFCVAGG